MSSVHEDQSVRIIHIVYQKQEQLDTGTHFSHIKYAIVH